MGVRKALWCYSANEQNGCMTCTLFAVRLIVPDSRSSCTEGSVAEEGLHPTDEERTGVSRTKSSCVCIGDESMSSARQLKACHDSPGGRGWRPWNSTCCRTGSQCNWQKTVEMLRGNILQSQLRSNTEMKWNV